MKKTIYHANTTSEKLEELLQGFEKHLLGTDRGASSRVYLSAVRSFIFNEDIT